ncbi:MULTISPECIES: OsmC family protein [Vitreoscilla]|uniref:OsmC family protein n=1 Tax=Vitreoscilla stercoraria TaxID=61 RepID=A0ABY4E858_VITST|nr:MULTISPECIES: OsmC family protein [Vitreoscilla]AUZ04321.1 OsmC-like peroxiredoxin [Vitreoscilla sp. C1]UOO91944.1 OsmC family protein [Vitreoscilla stercoraria]
MFITSQWVDGNCFVASNATGHTVVMDGSATAGEKRGASPMELLLMGIAGCSSIDVVSIAQKQRQDVVDCKARVEAVRAETVPKVFTEIHIHFTVVGRNLSEEAVGKAVSLSADKYCSASIMLGQAAKVTHSFEVVEA